MVKQQKRGSVYYINVHKAFLKIKKTGKLLLPISSVKREANEMYLRWKESESEEERE